MGQLISKKQPLWTQFSTIKLIFSGYLTFFPFRNQHHAVVHHSFLIAEQESAQGELHKGVGGVVLGLHLLYLRQPGGVRLRQYDLASQGEH